MSAQGVMVRDGSGARCSARRAATVDGIRLGGSRGARRAGGAVARPLVSRPAVSGRALLDRAVGPSSCRVGRVSCAQVLAGTQARIWAARALIGAIFAFGVFVVVSSFLGFSNEPIVGALGGLG